MRELNGLERAEMKTAGLQAAEKILAAVPDPERDPGIAAARSAVERLTAELEAAHGAATAADRGVSEARGRLQEALAAGKTTAKAWQGISQGEHEAAEAWVKFELTESAVGDAKASLAAARLTAVRAALPQAREAVMAAEATARAAEVIYLTAETALRHVRGRAGRLASSADILARPAVAGGAR